MWDKTCEVCGRQFTAARRDARFCSDACRQKAYRDRKEEELAEQRQIEHREVRFVYPGYLERLDAAEAAQAKREMATARWAERVHRNTGLVICAALLEASSSLELAASLLEEAGWSPHVADLTEEEFDEVYDDTERLRLWVEKYQEDIESARGSVFCLLAMKGKLMDPMPTHAADVEGEE